MIASLSGRVEDAGDGWAVVETGGVGYLVQCSARTLARLPERGAAVRLAVETHVRQDHIHLYGFADAAERGCFRLLLGVQGVGARVALAILSALSPDDLRRAVEAQDKAAVARANGVGARLAGRIVAELQSSLADFSAPSPDDGGNGAPRPDGGDPSPLEDAVSALANLGWSRTEAHAAAARARGALPEGERDAPAALIRAALRLLAAPAAPAAKDAP